jgi:hypothetical protein
VHPADIYRTKKIIDAIISDLQIDLSGFTILTEAGSNLFAFTPIIAAMCNAKKVYAWTRDSSHGKAEYIIENCKKIERLYDVPEVITYSANERPVPHVEEADIITNLGFVRPLNADFLSHLKAGTVVAAMCELWEVRDQDIDINYCKLKNLTVAGTWENCPPLEIFNSCGPLAIKLAMEAGFEVFKNRIIVWSDDEFGKVITAAFKIIGANDVIMTTDCNTLYQSISNVDFIFLCDYSEQSAILGKEGLFDINKIKALNPSVGFVHLYGKIDSAFVKNHDLKLFPVKDGFASTMSYTLAHLGPLPIIQLHAAGLKVGECLIKNLQHQLLQKIC